MYPLNAVPYTEIELRWDRKISGTAVPRVRQLRGCLAQYFADDPLFHQRDEQGQLIYRYPQIQYRWRQGHGVIAAWQEAARRLPQLPWLDLDLQLGEDKVQISDIILSTQKGQFGISPRLLPYRFISPVLLFNQKNYHHYKSLEKNGLQREERDRLLVAQLLVAMRGLQVHFEGQLYAAFTKVHSSSCRYKQQELLGITGAFMCNAVLPPGFAIGHGVSHGFGWILPA
jgi:hypothetical protein